MQIQSSTCTVIVMYGSSNGLFCISYYIGFYFGHMLRFLDGVLSFFLHFSCVLPRMQRRFLRATSEARLGRGTQTEFERQPPGPDVRRGRRHRRHNRPTVDHLRSRPVSEESICQQGVCMCVDFTLI